MDSTSLIDLISCFIIFSILIVVVSTRIINNLYLKLEKIFKIKESNQTKPE